MKIIAISDTHNKLSNIINKIPDGDLIVHAGDATGSGEIREVSKFCKEFGSLPHKHKIFVPGNHDCLDKHTELLTKRGWVRYDKIKLSDFVLSIDKSNNSRWTKINKIIKKKSDYIYKYKNSNIDMAITKNHRICYYKRDWKTQKDKTELFYDNIDNIPQMITSIPSAANKKKRDLNISDDFIRLLGWILTDGGIHKEIFNIYQSKKSGIIKIKKVLNNLGFEYVFRTRHRNIKEICGKPLKSPPLPQGIFSIKRKHNDEIKKFIGHKKNINKKEFDKLSSRQLKILITAFMDGDGSWNKKNYTSGALNGDKSFLDWVQTLAPQCGIRSTLVEYRPNTFRLNLSFKRSKTLSIGINKKIKKEYYNDIVWCLSVPHTNFMVRRNGKSYFTGNCLFETDTALAKQMCKDSGIICLIDESITIEGVNFHGSPVTPWFFDWAFNRIRGDADRMYCTQTNKEVFGRPIKPHWDIIPESTNVLITHGPPYGILDELVNGKCKGLFVGCESLLDKVKKVKPDLHIFGHIHCAHGEKHVDGTSFYNVSICTDSYIPSNKVTEIEYIIY